MLSEIKSGKTKCAIGPEATILQDQGGQSFQSRASYQTRTGIRSQFCLHVTTLVRNNRDRTAIICWQAENTEKHLVHRVRNDHARGKAGLASFGMFARSLLVEPRESGVGVAPRERESGIH